MTRNLRLVLIALGASIAAATPGQVSAQSYPNKPLRMVIPFAAGGSPDIIGRMVAEELSTILGQSVVVENRAGAGGNIAVQYVIDQPADGYTLLLGTSGNMASNKVLYRNLKFDTEVDLIPISVAYTTCNALIVPAARAEDRRGADRGSKSEAGRVVVRLARRRHRRPSDRRTVQDDDRCATHPRALSRPEPGHQRPARRPPLDVFRGRRDGHSGGAVRQDAGARGDLPAPAGAASGHTDLLRSRHPGLRAGGLGADRGTRQDAARHREETERGDGEDHLVAEGQRQGRRNGLAGEKLIAGRGAGYAERRRQALGRGGEGGRRSRRWTDGLRQYIGVPGTKASKAAQNWPR